jgi:hypothetical protein
MNFPAALAREGIADGEVRALLHVDHEGKLVDYLVTGYTRRELAEELVANVRDWHYVPARQRGEPVGSRVEVVFNFQARGMVLSLTPADTFVMSSNRLVRPASTSLVCSADELDEPVRTLYVVAPQHPGKRVSSSPPEPTVLLDFFIDMEGRPRMPVVRRAAHELYAAAAIDALMQWQFAPPTRHRQPMIVRATQLFKFSDTGLK